MNIDRILVCVMCAFTASHGANAQTGEPQLPRSSGLVQESNVVPDLFLFPYSTGHYACSAATLKWIENHVGPIDVACEYQSLYGVSFVEQETLIMEAGAGCYPYISLYNKGVASLRVAVTIPLIVDPKHGLKEVRIVADQDVRVIPITSETRLLESHKEFGSLLTLDLSTEVLTIDFLRQLAAAKTRLIFFGDEAKQKFTIGKRNARSIDGLIKLYDKVTSVSRHQTAGDGRARDKSPSVPDPAVSLSPAATGGDEPVAPTDDMVVPVVIYSVEPKYPDIAYRARIEGKVILKAIIDEEGNVTEVTVVNASNPLFEESAIEAAKAKRYKPALKNGRPVKVFFTDTITYRLRGE